MQASLILFSLSGWKLYKGMGSLAMDLYRSMPCLLLLLLVVVLRQPRWRLHTARQAKRSLAARRRSVRTSSLTADTLLALAELFIMTVTQLTITSRYDRPASRPVMMMMSSTLQQQQQQQQMLSSASRMRLWRRRTYNHGTVNRYGTDPVIHGRNIFTA